MFGDLTKYKFFIVRVIPTYHTRYSSSCLAVDFFASAYGLDPDFFAFYRSMKSYEESLGSDTTMVLSPDSEFFKYLNDPNAISSNKSNITKLSKEDLELISVIQRNDRLSDKLCPELVKID